MQKARINFSPLERAYNRKYGRFPDYHYIALYNKYGGEIASQTVQKNMDEIYQEEKEKAGYIKDGFYKVTEKDKVPF